MIDIGYYRRSLKRFINLIIGLHASNIKLERERERASQSASKNTTCEVFQNVPHTYF